MKSRMRRILYAVILLELALVLLLPVAAWLASVLGSDIQNPVSEEGVRWLFQHGASLLVAYPVPLVRYVLVILAIGAVRESSMPDDWLALNGRKLTDVGKRNVKRALHSAGIFLLCTTMCLVLALFVPHSPLLGVTGSIIPSPWFTGILPAFLLNVIIAATLYSTMRGTLGGLLGIARHFTAGFRFYGEWIGVFMLFSLLMNIGKYCLGN